MTRTVDFQTTSKNEASEVTRELVAQGADFRIKRDVLPRNKRQWTFIRTWHHGERPEAFFTR